jgi:uncharacterized protein
MTTDSNDDIEALAVRFGEAIERGDIEAARAMYAADAVIWHNTDNIEQSVDQNTQVLTWFVNNTASRTYTEVRRMIIENGFVQQHVVKLGFADGRTADMAACLIVKTSDGKIARIDEYLDSASVAAAFTGAR